jgi:Ca2+/Na+ antiporter
MGIAPLVTPMATPGINLLDLAVMLLCSVLLILFMRTGYLISRIEGIIFLVIYFAYPLVRIF